MKGKTPPNAIDLEEVIIGACLIDSYAIAETVEIFRNEPVFYKQEHQEVYNAMLEMFNNSEPIDLLTVCDALRKRKKLELIGGEYAIIQFTQKISTSANIERHCRIIQQYYIKRKSIQVGSQLAAKSYEDDTDIFELLDGSYKELDRVSAWLQTKKPSTLAEIRTKLFKTINSGETGVPSSLSKINNQTNGYQKSDLIILAARPGMGKTALMLNEVMACATSGKPVGIFSLEMSDTQLLGRMMANYCEIDTSKISRNKLSDEEVSILNLKGPKFDELPIYIHDQAALSTLELKIQASKWKRENKIEMLFVDYLQLMTVGKASKGNREQEISEISRSLKALAKELEIPIMALAQLSRAVETRGGMKRPQLSDLRESGAIEQDADAVMFLLRPEYYEIKEWDDRTPTDKQAEINFAKLRNAQPFSCVVRTKLQYMQFKDLNDFPETESTSIPTATPSQAFDEPSYNPDLDDNDDLPF